MASHWIDRGGEIWKNKAHSLQLQLRDRFRVAVDRRLRGRPIFSDDGYVSVTVQRWRHRFRDFRREALPSSNVFYRKRVDKDFKDEDSVVLRMLQSVAVPVIGNVCHVFMTGLNRVQVYGVEKLHEALLHRPKNKPLITVSNHVASVDDPFVIASLLPPSVLLDARNLRWTLCATDRCFKNPVTSAFFRSVKVLPVSRGDGIYQKGMDMAISKLNNGGWVHIFPEGSRSRDGGKTLGSPKRGVGRLILDSDNVPMVIPFVHSGMQEIMPIGASVPRIGKTVTVLVGDPIYFDDLLGAEETTEMLRGKLYDAVSSRIGHRLHELKVQVDKLALEQSLEAQWNYMQNTDRVTRIFHQVDWDSFGMGSYISAEDDDLKSIQEAVVSQPLDEVPKNVPTAICSDRYLGLGFSYEPGFVTRMQGYMDQLELMGFAARGLFMNLRHKEKPVSVGQIGPLRAWKQFLEAQVVGQWNNC